MKDMHFSENVRDVYCEKGSQRLNGTFVFYLPAKPDLLYSPTVRKRLTTLSILHLQNID